MSELACRSGQECPSYQYMGVAGTLRITSILWEVPGPPLTNYPISTYLPLSCRSVGIVLFADYSYGDYSRLVGDNGILRHCPTLKGFAGKVRKTGFFKKRVFHKSRL